MAQDELREMQKKYAETENNFNLTIGKLEKNKQDMKFYQDHYEQIKNRTEADCLGAKANDYIQIFDDEGSRVFRSAENVEKSLKKMWNIWEFTELNVEISSSFAKNGCLDKILSFEGVRKIIDEQR